MLGEVTVLFVHFLLDCVVCIVSGLLDFLRANRIAAQNIAHAFTGADCSHGVLEQADMEYRIFESMCDLWLGDRGNRVKSLPY